MNESAVMVLIEEQSNRLILTRRTDTLRHHPGEICFPGGMRHDEDANLYATALRELQEELGIRSERVKLIQQMRSEMTLTGYVIQPWLASVTLLNPYSAQAAEVAEVFTLPMEEVLKRRNYYPIEVLRNGKRLVTLQFKTSQCKVWGATARIMRQLCTEYPLQVK